MSIPVICEGCGFRYVASEAHAGKRGRCKQCGRMLRVPMASPEGSAARVEAESYALEERPEDGASTFVRTRGASDPERLPDRPSPGSPARRKKAPASRWSIPLPSRPALAIGLGVGGTLVAAAAFVVGGIWGAGIALTGLGLILSVYGFATGAYVAFTEDPLHGWLFLILPPYAAYYFVSRWEDMASRFAFVVAGLVLLSLGDRALEASLAAAARPAGGVAAVRGTGGGGSNRDDSLLGALILWTDRSNIRCDGAKAGGVPCRG